MSDEILKMAQKLPAEFDRRAFFTKIGLGSLGIAAAGTIAFSYEYLSPNVLYEPSAIVNAGKPENYAVNSVTMDVNSGIYLVRAEEGLLCAERCMHSSRLPYGLESGSRHHRVPMPRQQVQTHGRKD